MNVADTQVFPVWEQAQQNGRPQPRRVQGLRMPVLPAGSWLAQVGGACAELTGTYMQFGAAVSLMVGGVASVIVGALREAGKV